MQRQNNNEIYIPVSSSINAEGQKRDVPASSSINAGRQNNHNIRDLTLNNGNSIINSERSLRKAAKRDKVAVPLSASARRIGSSLSHLKRILFQHKLIKEEKLNNKTFQNWSQNNEAWMKRNDEKLKDPRIVEWEKKTEEWIKRFDNNLKHKNLTNTKAHSTKHYEINDQIEHQQLSSYEDPAFCVFDFLTSILVGENDAPRDYVSERLIDHYSELMRDDQHRVYKEMKSKRPPYQMQLKSDFKSHNREEKNDETWKNFVKEFEECERNRDKEICESEVKYENKTKDDIQVTKECEENFEKWYSSDKDYINKTHKTDHITNFGDTSAEKKLITKEHGLNSTSNDVEIPEHHQESTFNSDFILINDNYRILRATTHQANNTFFSSTNQCAAMVLANIIRTTIDPINRWNRTILDQNMLEGDAIYKVIKENNSNINSDGFLESSHFDVIRNNVSMYGQSFEINFADNGYFGMLDDTVDMSHISGRRLSEAVNELFQSHNAALFIAGGLSLGIIMFNDRFYLTDSHPCNFNGNYERNRFDHDTACVIECNTIQDLVNSIKQRIIDRGFSLNTVQYTLDFIDVKIKQKQDIEVGGDSKSTNDRASQQMESHTNKVRNIDLTINKIIKTDDAECKMYSKLDLSTIEVNNEKENIINLAELRPKREKRKIKESVKTKLKKDRLRKQNKRASIVFKEKDRKISLKSMKFKLSVDPLFKETQNKSSNKSNKIRMRNDPEYAKKRLADSVASKKERMENDPEYAKKRLADSVASKKERMENDPEYAKKRLADSVAITKNEKKRNPIFKIKRSSQTSSLMRTKRAVVQNRELEQKKNREAKEVIRKQKEEEKNAKKNKIRTEREMKMNDFYKTRLDFEEKLKNASSNKNSKNSHYESLKAKRLLKFITDLRKVPTDICCCCEGLFFNDYTSYFHSDKIFKKYSDEVRANKKKYQKSKDDIYIPKNDVIEFETVDDFEKYIKGKDSDKICLTCKRNLNNGKIPLINQHCGLFVPEVPSAVSTLTDLEERFCTFLTPFMQIRELKKSAINPQLGIKGAVINIPIEFHKFQDVLPRKFNNSNTLQINFKRDLSHQTSYMHETIRVKKIFDALSYLVNTELYKEHGIKIDENAFQEYDPSNTATQLNFIVNSDDCKTDKKFKNPNYTNFCSSDLKYTLFENTFNAKYKILENFSFQLLCAYNSLIHAFICCYKNIEKFSQYVQSKMTHVDLFHYIDQIVKCKDDQKRRDMYIDLLYNSVSKTGLEITLDEETAGQKNMENDSAVILSKFLTNGNVEAAHVSFKKHAVCNKSNCHGVSSNSLENEMIFIPFKFGESLHTNLEERITRIATTISEADISYNCGECNQVINDNPNNKFLLEKIDCKTTFNDFLFINIQTVNDFGQEAIANFNIYNDIPKTLNINGEHYDLVFFINKAPNHYKTFYRDNNDFILLDDNYSTADNPTKTIRCEKIVEPKDVKKGVNPSILMYIKKDLNFIDQLEHLSLNESCKKNIESNLIIDAKQEEIIENDESSVLNKNEKKQNDIKQEDEQEEEQEEVLLLKDCFESAMDYVLDDPSNHPTDKKRDMSYLSQKNKIIFAPGQGKTPIYSKNIANYDEVCFPKTYGGNKMKYDRKQISYTRASRAEIRHYSRKFCRTPLILFKTKEKIQRDVANSICIAVRKVKKGKKLTAKDVRDGKMLDCVINDGIAYKLLTNIRSSPMYLKKKKNHAFAMIKQFNSPHLFATVSFGEGYSPELLKQMKKNFTGEDISLLDALNLPTHEKTKYVRDDPVICAEVFNHRVNKLGSYANDASGNGLFGEHYVTHFIKRKEAQGRGTMHSHQVLWCKDAPRLDLLEQNLEKKKANEIEVIKFIDKVITTEYVEDHPNMVFHEHKCGHSCRKGTKHGEMQCRFGFPHFVSDKTKVIYPMPQKDKTPEMMSRLKKIREKMKVFRETKELKSFQDILTELEMNEEQYYEAVRCAYKRLDILYKRESNAVSINSYNKTLFNVWEGNHDMQYIADPYGFVHYLAKYCLKPDEGPLAALQKAEEECLDGNKTMFETLCKVSNAFINSSIITAQQAVEELLGFSVLKFSNAEKFINTNRPHNRVSLRKPMTELKKLEDDDENITNPDFIDEYAQRPDELKHICLADFAAKYKRQGQKEDTSDDEGDDNEDDDKVRPCGKTYVKRTKDRVIRSVNFRKEINEDEYKREMVMLYVPWNDEKNLLNKEFVNETFEQHMVEIFKTHSRYNSLDSADLERMLEEAYADLKAYKDIEIDEFNAMEAETDFIAKIDVFKELGIKLKYNNNENDNSDKKDYILTSPPRIDHKALYEDLQQLNEQQQLFVQHVYHIVKTMTEHKVYPKILFFGPAGSGKSKVLKVLNQLLTFHFDNIEGANFEAPKVLLAAYTGIAAYIIGGNTCHRAFCLQVNKRGKSLESEDTKNLVRSAHRDIKAIIIDELSFISRKTRNAIDLNCRKIYGNEHESFGGKLVIMMGDLFQLPPVCGHPIYKRIDTIKRRGKAKLNGKQLMDEVNIDNVWKEFRMFELTEIVRQKDLSYQTALNNLARGQMTPDDLKLIKARTFGNEADVPDSAVRLFYTNREVDSFNAKKIHSFSGNLIEVGAMDEIKGDKIPQDMKLLLKQDYKQDKVPSVNLKDNLLVKIGIRYMIVINVDVSDGIANGSRGVLEHITFSEQNDSQPLILWINFNDDKIGNKLKMPFIEYMRENNIPPHLVPIQKITRDMTTANRAFLSIKVLHEAFRTQFPVTPSEALTIHKVQGLTIPEICLDFRSLRKITLSVHLLYVALSRCDYKGLYILGEFKAPSKDEDNDIVGEIERLRREAPLQLSFYNFEQNLGKKIVYHNIRSFSSHRRDIRSINWYWKADVIILTESNVGSVAKSDIREDFTVLYPTFADAFDQTGRAKGIIILCKNVNDVQQLSKSNILNGTTSNGSKWHIDLRTFIIGNHYVITGYKSPKTPIDIFMINVKQLYANAPSGFCITVIGDFNFNMFKDNAFKKYLEELKFVNHLGDKKTTDENTQIDVVFSTSTTGIADHYASYFSDHFAICYQTEYDKNLSAPIQNIQDNKKTDAVASKDLNSPISKRQQTRVQKIKDEIAIDDKVKDKIYEFDQKCGIKIMYHHVLSFGSIKKDIKNNEQFWKPDIIIISERAASSIGDKDIDGDFKIFYKNTSTTVKNKERGLLILCKDERDICKFARPQITTGFSKPKELYHINITTFEVQNHIIITGFISSNTPIQVFKEKIALILSKVPIEMYTVVIGNFNIDMLKNNLLDKLFDQKTLVNKLGNKKTSDKQNAQNNIVFSSAPHGFGTCFESNLSNNYALLYQTEFDLETFLNTKEDLQQVESEEKRQNNQQIKDEISIDQKIKDKIYEFDQKCGIKIMYHNVLSFGSVKKDIENNEQFWKPDIIIISERAASSIGDKDIDGDFKIFYKNTSTTVKNKERGLLILCKDERDICKFERPQITTGFSKPKELYHINITTFEVENHFIITGFVSSNTPIQVFKEKIALILSKVPIEMYTVVIGNFNIDMLKNNLLDKLFDQKTLVNKLGNKKTSDKQNAQNNIVFSSAPHGFGTCFESNLSTNYALFYQTEFDMETFLDTKEDLQQVESEEKRQNNNQSIDLQMLNLMEDGDKYENLEMRTQEGFNNRRNSKRKNKVIENKPYEVTISDDVKHVAKFQKVSHNARTNLSKKDHSFPVLSNTINFSCNGSNITLQFLCSYNSFYHGLIGSYKLDQQFSTYIESNRQTFPFFNKIIQVSKIDDSLQRKKVWAQYLYENIILKRDTLPHVEGRFQSRSTANGIIYNMWWSHEGIINTLMPNFSSYTFEFNCDCGYTFTTQPNILNISCLDESVSLSDQLKSLTFNTLNGTTRRCIKCKKRQTPCNFIPNELLIVGCSFKNSLQHMPAQYSLNDISRALVINYYHYDLLFAINWENFNHFNTFVSSNLNFVHYDDLIESDKQKEIIINEKYCDQWKIYPNLLVFFKRFTDSQ